MPKLKKSPSVEVDGLRCACLGVAGGDTLWLLHILGVNANHGAERVAGRRDPGPGQLACSAALAHPVGGVAVFTVLRGDVGVAAEPDRVAKAQIVARQTSIQ